MEPYAFQDFSSRLPITEPMHVVRGVEANQWEVNNETARGEKRDSSPFSRASEREDEFVASIRSLIEKGKQACFQARHELEKAASDMRPAIRAAATDTLGMLEEWAPIGLLLEALTDPDWDVRAAAAQALGRVGEGVPTETLIEFLLLEKHESVQEALIGTLGLQKDRAPLDVLANFLQDGETWQPRVAAAWALGRQGKRAPSRPLIRALHDKDEMVREAAARVLGILQIRNNEIERALLHACHDSDEDVQEAANWALDQLSSLPFEIIQPPENFPTAFDKVQHWLSLSLQDALFLHTNACSDQQIQRNRSFTALTEFIRDKKGDLQQSMLFDSIGGQTLLIICDYQHARKNFLEILLNLKIIKITRTQHAAFDEIIQYAFTQAIVNGEKRPWDELLIVSFTLSPTFTTLKQNYPLRVVISGMGYPSIDNYKEPILDQIVTTWAESVNEPLVCQRPHDLIDLKIWYQPPKESWVLELASAQTNP